MTERAVETTNFWKKLDALLSRGERPSAQQIAQLAIESELSRRDALWHVQRMSHFGETPNKVVSDAMTAFVAALGGKNVTNSILEYTSQHTFLTERFLEIDGPEVTIVSPDASVADVADILFGSGHVVPSIEELDSTLTYDLVICQPPLGHRSSNPHSDGFGGEIVTTLVPYISKTGRLFWLTSRGVLGSKAAAGTLATLEELGLHLSATIDIPAGGFPGTPIEGVLLVFQHAEPTRKLVGALRDEEIAVPMASALLEGPTKKDGSSWAWLSRENTRSFADLENERLLKRFMPRGRYELTMLKEILGVEEILKADKPIPEGCEATGFLYIPEYAVSCVTADLEAQTVKLNAVYRLPIDTSRANPRFLAMLLNSPYGRQARITAAQGATIQRVTIANLKVLTLPIPDLKTQERLARIESDLDLMVSSFGELQETVTRDWTALEEVEGTVEGLKLVVDLERQIENWWRELPYPLATIYRRYQVATDSKERLDRLLHFFEMAAVYLATIGTSHIKVLKPDWQDYFTKWFHPAKRAGIERADFGFWTILAGASLKELSRIASNHESRLAASNHAGPELIEVAGSLGPLGKTTKTLDIVRGYRNSWKGHGGHLKAADAKRLDHELQESIRGFYEATAPIFRKFLLVQPGLAEVTDSGMSFQIELLRGSDPAFETKTVELSQPSKSGALAFWMVGARAMCRALPFFRLGVPQEPQESSFYVFNRIENEGFRWISYQEAREQEFIAPDDELSSLINLPKGGIS